MTQRTQTADSSTPSSGALPNAHIVELIAHKDAELLAQLSLQRASRIPELIAAGLNPGS
jgi:hypothetical protein